MVLESRPLQTITLLPLFNPRHTLTASFFYFLDSTGAASKIGALSLPSSAQSVSVAALGSTGAAISWVDSAGLHVGKDGVYRLPVRAAGHCRPERWTRM
jgi:hypothetical protein